MSASVTDHCPGSGTSHRPCTFSSIIAQSGWQTRHHKLYGGGQFLDGKYLMKVKHRKYIVLKNVTNKQNTYFKKPSICPPSSKIRVVDIQSWSVVKDTVTLPSNLNFESSEASCVSSEQHCSVQTANINPNESIRLKLTPNISVFTIATFIDQQIYTVRTCDAHAPYVVEKERLLTSGVTNVFFCKRFSTCYINLVWWLRVKVVIGSGLVLGYWRWTFDGKLWLPKKESVTASIKLAGSGFLVSNPLALVLLSQGLSLILFRF